MAAAAVGEKKSKWRQAKNKGILGAVKMVAAGNATVARNKEQEARLAQVLDDLAHFDAVCNTVRAAADKQTAELSVRQRMELCKTLVGPVEVVLGEQEEVRPCPRAHAPGHRSLGELRGFTASTPRQISAKMRERLARFQQARPRGACCHSPSPPLSFIRRIPLRRAGGGAG
jgi:hypothetical protein